jgi:hypothetical protein
MSPLLEFQSAPGFKAGRYALRTPPESRMHLVLERIHPLMLKRPSLRVDIVLELAFGVDEKATPRAIGVLVEGGRGMGSSGVIARTDSRCVGRH